MYYVLSTPDGGSPDLTDFISGEEARAFAETLAADGTSCSILQTIAEVHATLQPDFDVFNGVTRGRDYPAILGGRP